MTLRELYEKRAGIATQARAYNETHRDDWDEERQAAFDAMMADVNKLTDEIRRLEALEGIEMEGRQSNGRNVPPMPPAPDEDEPDSRAFTQTPEYREAYTRYLRTGNDSELRSMNITVDPSGGYLVPDQMHNTMVGALNDYLPMRNYATVLSVQSNLDVVYDNDDGVAYWGTEEGPRVESDNTFGLKKLGGHSERALQKVSRALIQDSAFDIASFVATGFGKRFAKLELSAFTTGDGIGKPTGFTVDAQVGKTTAVNNKIDPDEVMDLYFSLKAEYRGNAIWQMNDAVLCEVAKLKDGAGRYIWQLALAPGKPDTILGRPVVANSAMATVAGSAKVMAFGDFSYYWIVDRGTPIVQRLVELYAANGQDGFLQEKRVDGRLMVPEAIKLMVMHA